MTDFDLIARLRDFNKVTIGDARFAADRIEDLTKERDALTDKPARVRPMAWVQSLHFPAVSVAWCPVLEKHFYAEKPGDRERVEAKRAARILSAVITGAEVEA